MILTILVFIVILIGIFESSATNYPGSRIVMESSSLSIALEIKEGSLNLSLKVMDLLVLLVTVRPKNC